ncbi:uncharacterized protein LOC123375771 [Mauremys mutica]|uniref:uncharacterized protein LOC123375771 n=1 Tax=Mauremys mutica TaxID=74926 RepID=UPI001D168AD6|nr:uncharacterized protein LOC123375771 [Mauremys mutica]
MQANKFEVAFTGCVTRPHLPPPQGLTPSPAPEERGQKQGEKLRRFPSGSGRGGQDESHHRRAPGAERRRERARTQGRRRGCRRSKAWKGFKGDKEANKKGIFGSVPGSGRGYDLEVGSGVWSSGFRQHIKDKKFHAFVCLFFCTESLRDKIDKVICYILPQLPVTSLPPPHRSLLQAQSCPAEEGRVWAPLILQLNDVSWVLVPVVLRCCVLEAFLFSVQKIPSGVIGETWFPFPAILK